MLEAAHPVLPVTVRNLETGADDRTLALPGKLAAVREGDDAMVIGWLKHLESVRYGRSVPRASTQRSRRRQQPENSFSVLEKASPLAEFAVPKPDGGQAFEVVGIPLAGPGFYVVELASPQLGAAYLDSPSTYYTHTAALVTNLVAHAKIGRESSLVWVTALDSGLPVADAQVTVSDCDGKPAWQGATDAQGRARIAKTLGEAKRCKHWPGGWFVSARRDKDRSFTLTSWNDGIESVALQPAVRRNLGAGHRAQRARPEPPACGRHPGDEAFHSPAHRQRLCATGGESAMPTTVTLTHVGSGQAVSLPVKFDARGTAETQWAIPREAKLGAYDITLARASKSWSSGEFTVAAFRLPTMRAQIGLPKAELVRARSAEVDVGVQYLSGGGASLLPVKLRSLVEPMQLFASGFSRCRVRQRQRRAMASSATKRCMRTSTNSRTAPTRCPMRKARRVARTQAVTLDRAGAARLTVAGLPQKETLNTLRLELDYADANGVTQTVSQRATLWPGERIPGIAVARLERGRRAALHDGRDRPGWQSDDRRARRIRYLFRTHLQPSQTAGRRILCLRKRA